MNSNCSVAKFRADSGKFQERVNAKTVFARYKQPPRRFSREVEEYPSTIGGIIVEDRTKTPPIPRAPKDQPDTDAPQVPFIPWITPPIRVPGEISF